MKFNPGDKIICMEAPWHSEIGKFICQATGYGPQIGEEVTIECYPEKRYVILKEYPTANNLNAYAFNEAYFEMLVSDKHLEEDLKEIFQ